MKKLLIGRSPLTTIAGFLMATLLTVHQTASTGAHKWQDYILPAAIAVFGRMAGDSNKRPPLPPLPMPSEPEMPNLPLQPTSFQRRGRQHHQRRSGNGRFVSASA